MFDSPVEKLRKALRQGDIQKAETLILTKMENLLEDDGSGSSRRFINQPDKDGNTPLILMLMGGHDQLAEKLLEKYESYLADIDPSYAKKSAGGDTAMTLAIAHGCTRTFYKLLEFTQTHDYTKFLINEPGQEGRTPFLQSLHHGRPDMAAALRKAGADIHARDIYQRTALYWAAQSGLTDVVKSLIEEGVDINAADAYNMTPLMAAAAEGKLDALDALIAAKAVLDKKDANGNTAMLLAIAHRHPDLAVRLIEAGADHTVGDMYGETVLSWAVGRGQNDVVDAVIKTKKADMNLRNRQEIPLLITAIESGHIGIALKLIAAGANPNASFNNMPALFWALDRGQTDVVKALIAAGADVNAPNADGTTPLLHAIERDNVPAFDALLKAGADPDIVNHRGYSARFLSDRNARVKQLLENKPNAAQETWTLVSSETAMFVGVYPEMDRKITRIFNFAARERITHTVNLRTGAETDAQESFDDITLAAIEDALKKFEGLGGKIDRDFALYGKMGKLPTVPPANDAARQSLPASHAPRPEL